MRSLIFSWTSKEKDYQGVLTRTSGQDVSPIRRWLYFWRVSMGEKVFLKPSWWNGNGTNRIAARCQNEKKEETKDFLSVCSYLLPILDISLFSQVSLTPFLNCPHWTELVSLEGDFLPLSVSLLDEVNFFWGFSPRWRRLSPPSTHLLCTGSGTSTNFSFPPLSVLSIDKSKF